MGIRPVYQNQTGFEKIRGAIRGNRRGPGIRWSKPHPTLSKSSTVENKTSIIWRGDYSRGAARPSLAHSAGRLQGL